MSMKSKELEKVLKDIKKAKSNGETYVHYSNTQTKDNDWEQLKKLGYSVQIQNRQSYEGFCKVYTCEMMIKW